MVTKKRVFCHIFSDAHITTTKTSPFRIQNTARYLLFIIWRTHQYYTKIAFHPIYTTTIVLLYISLLGTPSKLITSHYSHPYSGKNIFAILCPGGENLTNIPCPRGANIETYVAAWLQRILTAHIEVTGCPPPLVWHHLPTLNIPLILLKSLVNRKNAHSSITSHRTFFIPPTHGIQFSYIVTTSNQYWQNWHNTI